MKQITVTALGVSVKVDPNAFDDEDLLEKLEMTSCAQYDFERAQDGGTPEEVAEAQRLLGQASLVSRSALRRALFGTDWERIKRELADEKGKLSATRAEEFIDAVSTQISSVKN